MRAEFCKHACDQGRTCPLRRPTSEHYLAILKLKLLGVLLLLAALGLLRLAVALSEISQ